jgi:hypothetical protein
VEECSSTVLNDFSSVALVVFFGITFILCVIQFLRNIYYKSVNYQVAVLFLAACETLLGVIHWGFAPSTTFDYWMIYLKEIELTIITYFFMLSAVITFNQRWMHKV